MGVRSEIQITMASLVRVYVNDVLNMKTIKKSATKIIIVSVSLLVLVGLLICIVNRKEENKSLEIAIQIYGAFLATLFGVYLSLYYSKKEEKERQKYESDKILQGSLKLVWSELDLNSTTLNNLINGLKSMPRNLNKLYEQYNFLIESAKNIKYQTFYSLVSSSAINEICLNDDIFNPLQQAYYNTELTVNGLNISTQVFKDYADQPLNTIPSEFRTIAFNLLDKETSKVERTLKLVDKAKKVISEYLKTKGVTFKYEK